MYFIQFDPKADTEYQEAYAWYEEQLQGLGERFEFSVEQKLVSVLAAPLLYPIKKYDIRECKINGFPYLIIYKFYPLKNLILIISIFHTSRNPRKKLPNLRKRS
ncbi:type II toxin-antitoxin system RelE/ParE family toxin [Mucilaginibacter terrigena]|uniref:type II toxin-antitoxin system RelE/ParE family toxin n=1 Tax=Mucilaginibacter terrigena TaxID=2492395 RepID=UPI0013968A82|nr:type II toxin-antitoxin system RelE/ParE family toxin [Mucilaginibacter terrigena]